MKSIYAQGYVKVVLILFGRGWFMKKLTVLASVLAAALASSTIAQAACTQAHVNNKYWKLTANDRDLGVLIFCDFRTSSSGTIAGNVNGCEYNTIGVDIDFSHPHTLEIVSGSIALVPGNSCTYDANLTLGHGGPTALKARVVLESGKTIANGNYLMSTTLGAGSNIGGGTISLMKQAQR